MKLIKAEFNRESGESIVILQNKNGQYIGKARLHPEDKEFANEFTGCRLAEQRAWLDFYKKELNKTKIKLKTLENFYKDFILYEKEYCSSARERIKIHIKHYKNYIEELKTEITKNKEHIKKSIEIRNSLIKKIKEDKQD